MKRLLDNVKLQGTLEIIFKFLFLLYTMISFNSILFGNRVISFVLWPTLLLGTVLVLWRLIKYKDYYRMPGLPAMFLFLASFIVSMLIYLRYDAKNNFITLIYLSFYFLLLYLIDEKRDLEKLKKEFRFFAWIFVIYMAICVAVSLTQMFVGYSYVYKVQPDNYEVITGFIWGRLWGVFLDPNVASVMAVIACYFSVYFFFHYKKIVLKVIMVINVIFQVFYIAFTDSRTALVSIFASLFVGLFIYFWYKWESRFINFIKATAIALLAALIVAGIPHYTLLAYNSIASNVNISSSSGDQDIPTVERNYDLEGDVSNRRFEIWKSALEIFEKTPVFGTSYYGIRPFAREYVPNTYIINNDQVDFRNMHNEIINVATAQGTLGLIALFWMGASILIFILKRFRKIEKKDFNMVCLLFTCIVCLACSAMFVSAGMFYYSAPSTVLFWMLLGYLVFTIKKSSVKDENSLLQGEN